MNLDIFHAIKHGFSVVTSMMFGDFHWDAPKWMNKINQTRQTRPFRFWSFSAILLLILMGIFFYIHWLGHTPKSSLVQAVISPPEITEVDAEYTTLQPIPIEIEFILPIADNKPQSVAPLQSIGKTVTEGVTLSPVMEGVWLWENDHKLLFTPKHDWPADTEYTITFNKTFFSPETKIQKYKWSFHTKPFSAVISNLQFYQDPVDLEKKQIVATIDFNFPVDPKSFTEKLALRVQSIETDNINLPAYDLPYQITYDEFKRKAYLVSENITLPEISRVVEITLNSGIQSESHSGKTSELITKTVIIPDRKTYLKVTSAQVQILSNQQGIPEQILTLETTAGVSDQALLKSLHTFLLPARKDNLPWNSASEVTESILENAEPLTLESIPSERQYSTLHSFRMKIKTPRTIYLTIDKGLNAFGGYVLEDSYRTVMNAPEYPKSIRFLHQGALLSTHSEKKLSVMIRGMSAVKFSIARVLPENVNQLVTQTSGDFSNPNFINWNFNEKNIAEIFREIQTFPTTDLSQLFYSAIDVNRYLQQGTNAKGPNGLFLLKAEEWDPVNHQSLGSQTTRLLLVSDLGLMVKDNNDGSHDFYVQSIAKGESLENAAVSVLGKNGVSVLSQLSDQQGHAHFPDLKDYIDEKEPVAYIVNLNGDISFIPFNQYSRKLNYSRFDIGGAYDSTLPNQLNAYLFTDRGIYRPGDNIHLAMILKQGYIKQQPAGLPLQLTIQDPQGNIFLDRQLQTDDSEFVTVDLQTKEISAIGTYAVNLYLVKDNRADALLGSTTFQVQSFLPDTLKISANWLPQANQGWLSPVDLQAKILLMNLFGSPAKERNIESTLVLSPVIPSFSQYPDYIFSDPMRDPDKEAQIITDKLAARKTNENGEAIIDLNLQRFDPVCAQVKLITEGFAAESGRSVSTVLSTLISPLSYLLGYKPLQDLHYLKINSQPQIDVIAVNKKLEKQAVDKLTLSYFKVIPISTLIKNPNGTYEYKSVNSYQLINSQPFTIANNGVPVTLNTDTIGDYQLRIMDEKSKVLLSVPYSVVGDAIVPLPKNAEMQVKLNKENYKPGETIELQITSPYTGSGLITIERDKVYAQQWFKTATTSSVQQITLPADFDGNGYVTVTFVRAWDSPEIFVSPLSFQVQPFSISTDDHNIRIDLTAKSLAKPGESFDVTYKTDKPSKIILFAVDEGILQVANYDTPSPLQYFFQKRALQVYTQQTLDLILPEYLVDRERSAVGGDGESADLISAHLNPFKRKTDLPVVFWSGVIDASSTTNTLSWTIPDYFNGQLRVMAVAVSADAMGSAETDVIVHGDFVISPNTPLFIAPGDIVDVSVSVANQLDQKTSAQINVTAAASSGLSIMGSNQQSLTLNKNDEKTLHYQVKANDQLGEASLTFSVNYQNKVTALKTSLSIRPPFDFTTMMQTGILKSKDKTITLSEDFYPEFHQRSAVFSTNPTILLSGIERYLQNYPFGCTEQLVSKAFPWLALNLVPEKIQTTIDMLASRQLSSGGFAYWPGASDEADPLMSLYSMQFLIEAREKRFQIPEQLMTAGLRYLRDFAAKTPQNLEEARNQSYAIYLLTRNEEITTNYLTTLLLSLSQHRDWKWEKDMTVVWIAATYQLLKDQKEAERLIAITQDFSQDNLALAQYLYVIAKHFPAMKQTVSEKFLLPFINHLNISDINTLIAGYSTLTISAFADQQTVDSTLSITAIDSKGQSIPFKDNDLVASGIRFNNPESKYAFYQVIDAGFVKVLPKDTIKNGLEVYREYRNSKGETVTQAVQGETLTVDVQIRSLSESYIDNVAIIDLLPAGFEVDRESLKNNTIEYQEAREDRVLFFLSVTNEINHLTYKMKAVNTGIFTVPAISAVAMYAPQTKASGVVSSLRVINPN